jgi:hypothetical protein
VLSHSQRLHGPTFGLRDAQLSGAPTPACRRVTQTPDLPQRAL